jgi:type II secretory ATPase GspE/PulE/Tfp pilus assembly ATPase PilB-like protein
MECAVELVNGQMLHEELVEFDPDDGYIGLQWAKPEDIKRIEFEKFNSIVLTLPRAYTAAEDALEAIGGAGRRSDSEKPFTINLASGRKMRGNTLGFVKDKAGLFLFPVGDDGTHLSRCFIPAAQITALQIGDLLGNMLVDKQVISAEALMQALGQQSQLRQERLGGYLTQRAILTAAQLTLALRAQEKQPGARLGEILLEQKFITAEQLQEALSIQDSQRGRRIGKILIDMGVVSMPLIQLALSAKLGTPYVDVRDFTIGPGALESIDAAFAIQHQVLPLLRIGESLVVAIEDPLALDFAHDLRFKAGMSIDAVIANPLDLEARIAREYSSMAGCRGEAGARTGDAPVAGDDTSVKLVNKMIIEAYAQNASTIHIESNGDKGVTRIRLRKDGVLVGYLELPYARGNELVSKIKVMAKLDTGGGGHHQQGKFHLNKHGLLPLEVRVRVIPTDNNLEDVVLRIAGGTEPLPLDELGFSAPDLEQLKRMIAHRYGLILVCGPAESGRTTTLHSMLHEINRPDMKIWTAEDPIEVTQPGMRQVQVHAEQGWTFAAATRAFIGADPDVIMIGAMLDAETMKVGIEAALNGHLVLSTLETHSAVASVTRLMDPSVGSLDCADAFLGVLSQRLAPRLCANCARSHVASPAETSALLEEYCRGTSLDAAAVEARWRKEFGTEGHLVLREATGCAACRDGYRKRVLVYELLAGTPEIKHLIHTHGTAQQLLAAAQADGMRSMQQNAIDSVLRGVLDLLSARTVAGD